MTVAPEPRIGDSDRDRAIEQLREHYAAGRLDASEFDERMDKALQAKTASDLRPLFVDLPVDPSATVQFTAPTLPDYSASSDPGLAPQTGIRKYPRSKAPANRINRSVSTVIIVAAVAFMFIGAARHMWWLWVVLLVLIPLIQRHPSPSRHDDPPELDS